jgi:hypothetical protein
MKSKDIYKFDSLTLESSTSYVKEEIGKFLVPIYFDVKINALDLYEYIYVEQNKEGLVNILDKDQSEAFNILSLVIDEDDSEAIINQQSCYEYLHGEEIKVGEISLIKFNVPLILKLSDLERAFWTIDGCARGEGNGNFYNHYIETTLNKKGAVPEEIYYIDEVKIVPLFRNHNLSKIALCSLLSDYCLNKYVGYYPCPRSKGSNIEKRYDRRRDILVKHFKDCNLRRYNSKYNIVFNKKWTMPSWYQKRIYEIVNRAYII